MFQQSGGASAAYADVVYPMEARRDRGSHPTLNDVRRLLAGINGPAHQLIRNDAFNILDRAVLAGALPGQTREAVFAAAVQGLRAAAPKPNLARACAAHFLGDFGDRRAIRPLLPLRRDPDDLVRMMARLSLKKLGYGARSGQREQLVLDGGVTPLTPPSR